MTKQEREAAQVNKASLLRVIRLSELPIYVGLKRSQIDELIRSGEFPPPIKRPRERLARTRDHRLAAKAHRAARRQCQAPGAVNAPKPRAAGDAVERQLDDLTLDREEE